MCDGTSITSLYSGVGYLDVYYHMGHHNLQAGRRISAPHFLFYVYLDLGAESGENILIMKKLLLLTLVLLSSSVSYAYKFKTINPSISFDKVDEEGFRSIITSSHGMCYDKTDAYLVDADLANVTSSDGVTVYSIQCIFHSFKYFNINIEAGEKIHFKFENGETLSLETTSGSSLVYSGTSVKRISVSYKLSQEQLEKLINNRVYKVRFETCGGAKNFDCGFDGNRVSELLKVLYETIQAQLKIKKEYLSDF